MVKVSLLGLLVIALSLPNTSFAGIISKTYGFGRITNNAAENVASQLTVVVSGDTSLNSATFTFFNSATTASSITDIYFQDGTLLGIASITGSSGVSFTQGANPGNLPSGNDLTPNFVTTAGFSLDSNAPQLSDNGVNAASEWVSVTFNLINSKTIVDTIAALDLVHSVGAAAIWDNNGAYLNSGVSALRIGLHVQAIGARSESDGFVSAAIPQTPEPTSLVTLGCMGALALLQRRRAKLG